MSAYAFVTQLVRAHYRGDDSAFASAALALARGATSVTARSQLIDLVREGSSQQRRPGPQVVPMRPVPLPLPPSDGMLEVLRPVAFDDLVLPPLLQAQLDELLIELEHAEELARRRLRPRSRLLFHGPPGCGKSSCGSAIATALGRHALGVSLPRVISKYIGETGANLGKIFSHITDATVVVFDEIDALGASRGEVAQSAGKEFNGIVNTLLTLLDRNRIGTIVATTNRLDIVDSALVRRFDEVLEFPAPDAEKLRALADKLAAEYGIEPIDGDVLSTCKNYDAVTKLLEREGRRIVMREILAAEDAAESEEENHGSSEEDDQQEAG